MLLLHPLEALVQVDVMPAANRGVAPLSYNNFLHNQIKENRGEESLMSIKPICKKELQKI
jgi:hypothetical protein